MRRRRSGIRTGDCLRGSRLKIDICILYSWRRKLQFNRVILLFGIIEGKVLILLYSLSSLLIVLLQGTPSLGSILPQSLRGGLVSLSSRKSL